MRKLAVLALYISVILFAAGCGDDDKDKGPTEPGPGGDLTGIDGKIENWNMGTGKKLYFSMPVSSTQDVVFGSSDISGDGSFQMEVKEPTSEYLFPLSTFIANNNCQASTVISDPSAQCSFAQLNVAEGNSFIGYIDRSNSYYEKDSVGAFYSMFIYADREVSVSGVDSCQLENGMTGIGTYNVVLEKGWNQVIVTTTYFDSEEYHVTYSVGEPAGARFIYFGYGNNGLSKKSGSYKRSPMLKEIN